jgi:2-methylcitrate dehydratase
LPDSLNRPEVRALIERIDTHIDPECERIYPGTRSGAVHILLRDERRLEARVLEPKGEAANPMSDADLEAKFRANCEPIVGASRCDELLQQVWHFEALNNIRDFLGALARR